MRCFIGIDLGSTTTKAVVMDEQQNVIGRGSTNSRSNYDTAAAIAKQEALVNGRFHLFREALGTSRALNGALDSFLGQLERDFRLEQYVEQLGDLEATCQRSLETAKFGDATAAVGEALTEVFKRLRAEAAALFAPGAKRKSDFFRDIAGSQYLATGEAVAKDAELRYDFLLNVFVLDHRCRQPRLLRLNPASFTSRNASSSARPIASSTTPLFARLPRRSSRSTKRSTRNAGARRRRAPVA